MARTAGAVPEFSHHVKVEQPVDGPTAQVFNDLLASTQIAMERIARQHSNLQDRCDEMSRENASLRTANTKLKEEAAKLREENSQLAKQLEEATASPPSERQIMTPPPPPPAFELQRKIKIHDAPVHSVTMGANSKVVATASWDSTVKLYNLQQGEVVRTLGQEGEIKMAGLYAVAFAKTAPEVLGCTSCDKSVYLWNHTTGQMLSKLTGHTDEVNGIDFHASQQVMCTASDDCKVIIWDFQEGLTLRTLNNHSKQVYGTTFLGLEHQYLVATCCFDQKTRIFDMRDKQIVAMLQTHTDDVIGIDYSSPKQCLATGSDDGLIALWDTRNWKLQQKIETRDDQGLHENEVKRVAFSPSGTQLAAACSSGRVLIYNIDTNPAVQVAQLTGHTDCVFDVTWGVCPLTNTKMLVSASHDHTVQYWREVADSSFSPPPPPVQATSRTPPPPPPTQATATNEDMVF